MSRIRFHGSLNDFLPMRQRGAWIAYSLTYTPSIKDAIEVLGVPHVEVERMVVNGQPVGFQHALQASEEVEVYPFEVVLHAPRRFILDVHLGKLARHIGQRQAGRCTQPREHSRRELRQSGRRAT